MNVEKLWRLITRSWQGFGDDNCSQMAAAMSYHVLFAIVPLAMFAVSLTSVVAGTQEVQDRIVANTTEYLGVDEGDVFLELSSAGLTRTTTAHGEEAAAQIEGELASLTEDEEREHVETLAAGRPITVASYQLSQADVSVRADNLLAQTLRGVVNVSGPLSLVSFLVLAFSASGLFGTMRRSLDVIWNVQQRRPLAQGKLVDLFMLFAALFGLIVLLGLSLGVTAFLAAVRFGGAVGSVTWILAPWVITFVFCLLMYRYGPHVLNRFRDIWPGAALTATSLELLKYGYTIYIVNFSNYDVIYGAMGGIMLFMFFVYLAAFLFLFGAEVATEYPRVLSESYTDGGALGEGPSRPISERILGGVRSLFVSKHD